MKEGRTVWTMSKAFTLRYVRDKIALFFTFVFPVVFLVIFGFMFRNTGATFKLALINDSSTPFAAQFESQLRQSDSFKFTDVETIGEAKTELQRQEIDLIVIMPENFGAIDARGLPSGELQIQYATSDEQTIQTYQSVFNGVIAQINESLVPSSPPITLKTENLSINVVSRFDYLFAGVLGFALLSLGVYSMANGFPSDKQTGALRRLRIAPLRVWQLIVSIGFSRIVVGVIIAVVMYILAAVLFGFRIQGSIPLALAFTVISTICMFGFGMAIGGWAKNENQAAPVAQLVTLPMMFLSGTFFPRFIMPEAIQTISTYLPLTPVIDGLRMIVTEGAGVADILPELGIIFAWTVIIYSIAIRVFRWE
jgi:ABC-2 type transport system permease protein